MGRPDARPVPRDLGPIDRTRAGRFQDGDHRFGITHDSSLFVMPELTRTRLVSNQFATSTILTNGDVLLRPSCVAEPRDDVRAVAFFQIDLNSGVDLSHNKS